MQCYWFSSDNPTEMQWRKVEKFLIDEFNADASVQSPSNQQFPILDNATVERLSGDFLFSIWQKVDEGHTAVRFCTSWATKEENVDKLCDALRQFVNL